MYQTLIRCKEMLASHDYILVVENISHFNNYKVVRKLVDRFNLLLVIHNLKPIF